MQVHVSLGLELARRCEFTYWTPVHLPVLDASAPLCVLCVESDADHPDRADV